MNKPNKLNYIDKAGGRGFAKQSFRNAIDHLKYIGMYYPYMAAIEPPNCSPSLSLTEYYLPLERLN